MKIGWWSAGITSAVACKIALEIYEHVELFYIETGQAHPDNTRFKADCERWYGRPIISVQNSKGYKNPIDVVYRERFINGPTGAKCTKVLKKDVRYELEERYKDSLTNQIFGFEYERSQVNRAIRFMQQYPAANALVPLIEKGLTKDHCAGLLLSAGIELPAMYKMGYSNNNCIGCLKGGKGYWNKIRNDFPDIFHATAEAERHINRSCIKGTFLDGLEPQSGVTPKIVMPECGTFCEIEFADLEDKSLDNIMSGVISIYEAIKIAV